MVYAQHPQVCSRNGFDLTYVANTDDGAYHYWEENSGSSSSNVIIERLDSKSEIIWSAKAERGCTQGVSRCYLILPFTLDGELGGEIRVEMNWLAVDERKFVVFSHLSEKIEYTYSKANPFRDFALVSAESIFRYKFDKIEFLIENVFEDFVCEAFISK